MKKTQQPSRKPPKSAAELGRALGVTKQAVRKWIQRGDWPWKNMPKGGWDVQAVSDWRLNTLRPVAGDITPTRGGKLDVEKRARVGLLVERRLAIELDRRIKAGELIRTDDVERIRVAAIHGCRSRLQSLPRQIAGDLVGMNAEQIVVVLAEHCDAIGREYAAAVNQRTRRAS